MPYIPKERREKIDHIVEAMENAGVVADGDLNYILFKLCKGLPPGYNTYKNFCGELRQCATEIERRLLAPYENEKIKINGDVD